MHMVPDVKAPNTHVVLLQNSAYRVGLSFTWLLKSATNSQTSTGFEFAITASKMTLCLCVLKIKYRNTLNKHTHKILFLNHLLCIVSGNKQP